MGRAPCRWPGPGLPPFRLASGRQGGGGWAAGLRRGCPPQRRGDGGLGNFIKHVDQCGIRLRVPSAKGCPQAAVRLHANTSTWPVAVEASHLG